jgi:hypothetical protein
MTKLVRHENYSIQTEGFLFLPCKEIKYACIILYILTCLNIIDKVAVITCLYINMCVYVSLKVLDVRLPCMSEKRGGTETDVNPHAKAYEQYAPLRSVFV